MALGFSKKCITNTCLGNGPITNLILKNLAYLWSILNLYNIRDAFINDTLEEKKPMTRLKYADAVKIIYNGREEQDTVGVRRFRYR